MNDLNKALGDIGSIRRQVARSTQFRGYGPFTLAATGISYRWEAKLLALLAENRLAGELDAVALDGEHLDQDLIALAELVLDFLDAMLCDLGDVEEPVGAWEDLDERAELGESHDLAEVGLTYFRDSRDVGDHLDGAGETIGVGRGYIDPARVVDIDLDSSGIDDAADDLTAGSDEVADLVGGDLDGVDPGSELRLLFSSLGDDGVHGVE